MRSTHGAPSQGPHTLTPRTPPQASERTSAPPSAGRSSGLSPSGLSPPPEQGLGPQGLGGTGPPRGPSPSTPLRSSLSLRSSLAAPPPPPQGGAAVRLPTNLFPSATLGRTPSTPVEPPPSSESQAKASCLPPSPALPPRARPRRAAYPPPLPCPLEPGQDELPIPCKAAAPSLAPCPLPFLCHFPARPSLPRIPPPSLPTPPHPKHLPLRTTGERRDGSDADGQVAAPQRRAAASHRVDVERAGAAATCCRVATLDHASRHRLAAPAAGRQWRQ